MDFHFGIHGILLPIVAFVAGVLSAVTGGSGMVILPTLMIAGLSPHMALGTNKLFTTANLLTSALTFIRKGVFNSRVWFAAGIATFAGALGGALFALIVSNHYLKYCLPIVLLGATIFMMLPQRDTTEDQENRKTERKPNTLSSQMTALLIGAYSGFIGAGTGIIWTSVSMKLFNANMIEASAISRFMSFLSNCAALIVFVKLNKVNYSIGFSLIAMSVAGAFLGTKLLINHGNKFVKPSLLTIISLMSLKLVYDWCV